MPADDNRIHDAFSAVARRSVVRDVLNVADAALPFAGERAQAGSDLLFRALHAASNHFLVIDMTREERPIVFANRALATRHGTTPEKLIGMSLETFRGNAPRSDAINAAMREGRVFRTEIHSQRNWK